MTTSTSTSTSIFFLTDLDIRRIEEKLTQLREEAQGLSRKTNEEVLKGVRKEEEIGCEGDRTLFNVTSKMRHLQHLINGAERVYMPFEADKVMLGTKVTILRDGEEQTWEVVGHMQSECEERRIAYDTPLGSLLYGKQAGEEFLGDCCGKSTTIKVLAIEVANGNGKLDH